MIRSQKVPIEIEKKLLSCLEHDNDLMVEKLLDNLCQYNPILYSLPPKLKQLQKYPNFICAAAYFGALKVLRYLFQVNMNPDVEDSRGRNIAHFAVFSNNVEVFLFINEMGISIDKPSKNKKRPLHIAAKHGFLDICHYLVAAGANFHECDCKGYYPIHYAVMHNRENVVDFLEKIGCSEDLTKINLYATAIKGKRFDMLLYLIHHNIPQECGKGGVHPFHIAVMSKFDDLVELMLNSGSDPTYADNNGKSGLHYAVKTESISIVTMVASAVYEKLGYVDLYDKRMQTPLHYAARTGNVSIVSLLVDFGADLYSVDKDGNTPFDIAIDYQNEGVIVFFEEMGIYDIEE